MPVIRLFPFLPLTDAVRPSQIRVAFDVPESSRFQFSVHFFVGLFGVKLTRKEVSAMIDFFQGCEQELVMGWGDTGRWVIPSAVLLLSERLCAEENVLALCAQCRAVFLEIQMTACSYTWGRFDLYLRIGERFTSETGQIVSASRHLHHEHSAHSFDGYRLWLRFRSISINVDFIITQAVLIRRFNS